MHLYEVSADEFLRLQILFDMVGILYATDVVHTDTDPPTFVAVDEEMEVLLSSVSARFGKIYYLMPHGYAQLRKLKEPFVGIDGILKEFKI